MQRVSTNLTLFYKFFIPVFLTTLGGAAVAAMLIYGFAGGAARWSIVVAYAALVALMGLTLFRLKRVEMDDDFVYVTNYFRHFRYPYSNIERIIERDLLLFRLAIIVLRKPGSFGKTMYFVPSGSFYNDFWEHHPELRVELLRKK
jgi:hypothetical protein